MNRGRQGVIACLAVALLVAAASRAQARDNFLVIILDDVGVDGINIYSRDDLYGHPGEGASPGLTPNIDALALEGVLFRNAWTNPLCAPTRAQLLTGRHGFRTGIGVPNGARLDLSETTLPKMLAATHLNAAVGKWHLGGGDADHPNDSGFDYYAGGLRGGVGDYDNWTKTINGLTQQNHTVYATTDTADEAVAAIQAFGENQFLLWVAFNAPHSPFHVPDSSLQGTGIDDSASTTEKWKAMIEAADTEIGRILAAMSPTVRADTHVFVIADNGSPRQAVEFPFDSTRAKGSLYEGGVNVPFIVSSPLTPPLLRGSESSALVATVDVYDTLAEIMGVAATSEDSLSFVAYLEDPTTPTQAVRPFVFAERFEPNGDPPYTDHQKAVRDETYKLIWRNGVIEEFFNLAADPWEINNLLPISNLTTQELAAYDDLADAIDDPSIPVPEPGLEVGFVAGVAFLALASRRRSRQPRNGTVSPRLESS